MTPFVVIFLTKICHCQVTWICDEAEKQCDHAVYLNKEYDFPAGQIEGTIVISCVVSAVKEFNLTL